MATLFKNPIMGARLNDKNPSIADHPEFSQLTDQDIVIIGIGIRPKKESDIREQTPLIFVLKEDYSSEKRFEESERMQVLARFFQGVDQIISQIQERLHEEDLLPEE